MKILKRTHLSPVKIVFGTTALFVLYFALFGRQHKRGGASGREWMLRLRGGCNSRHILLILPQKLPFRSVCVLKSRYRVSATVLDDKS